ncbi:MULTISPECIES: phospholipid carrier-dependent glycosyltransferase [Pseudanabaena]|uniref:Polyprenol-phosphate-mannose--protein mannosyltransferase n=2 Tax=Pseudanabaena TaxID=1152 RepID=L8N3B9_9CYAN|nr:MULTISPECIES: phospholipid carrier-dependent glycosyltransferase [Pseudanabaena]ELS33594.1 glycosyl transferase family 39 [Pseudanabaena biceps PCC 7429]MDG3494196.1 phospholipid carrier-dependent glycosyltransferase [Pseudanabaena catenata USMAC16]
MQNLQKPLQKKNSEPISGNISEQNSEKNALGSLNNYQTSWDLYLILGAVGIFAIAALLHFWQLGTVPYPIFDEVLFGKYAEEYLDGNPTWEGHPPLGKFFIMLGILIFGRNEIGYRLLSACFGSIAPLLLIGLVYRLTHKRNFALLSGLFLCSDGLFLVESRTGLLNIFLVSFGITSQIFLVAALEQKGKLRTWLLCCAGLMLGASTSVKWNGLGFSLLVFLVVSLVWIIAKFFPKNLAKLGIFREITTLYWWQYILGFVLAPLAFYLVQWLPLFILNPGGVAPETGLGAIHSFWESLVRVQNHIIWWHNTAEMISTPEHPSHPYCSTVISWPVLARTVGYYFQDRDGYFTVMQGLGNPILWWFSTIAIVFITITSLLPKFQKFSNIGSNNYLLLGYFANYAPWLLVKRCLFVYHYLSSAAFSFVALAWIVSQMLDRKGIVSYLGYVIIALVLLSQIFFLPIWIGLPVSHSAFYERMWFMPDSVPGFNWI